MLTQYQAVNIINQSWPVHDLDTVYAISKCSYSNVGSMVPDFFFFFFFEEELEFRFFKWKNLSIYGFFFFFLEIPYG